MSKSDVSRDLVPNNFLIWSIPVGSEASPFRLGKWSVVHLPTVARTNSASTKIVVFPQNVGDHRKGVSSFTLMRFPAFSWTLLVGALGAAIFRRLGKMKRNWRALLQDRMEEVEIYARAKMKRDMKK